MFKIVKKVVTVAVLVVAMLSMSLTAFANGNEQAEVAIRAFFEGEGAYVEWYSPLRQITITLDGQELKLYPDSNTAYFNNAPNLYLSRPIRLEAGTAYMDYGDARHFLSLLQAPKAPPAEIPISIIDTEPTDTEAVPTDTEPVDVPTAITDEEPTYTPSVITDAQRFVDEHVAFNNTLRANGEPHHYMVLPIDNTVVYASFDDLMYLLDGGTGVFFFGRPTCPWCRYSYSLLLQIAIEKNITLLYYDPEYDRTAHNENYIAFLQRLHNYLPVDDRNQSPDDPDFDPEMKRVTVPHIFVVINGEVVAQVMLNRHQLLVDEDFDGLEALLREMLSMLDRDITDPSTDYYPDELSEDYADPATYDNDEPTCPVC